MLQSKKSAHGNGGQRAENGGVACADERELNMVKMLVVEDDAVLGNTISQGLSEQGYDCKWSSTGHQAIELANRDNFDVIVLDLMLPDMTGLEVLKIIRDNKNETPVLILTALGSVDERVKGLNAGADDYLGKPFAFAELTARLEAIRRRSSKAAVTRLKVGDLSMELTTRHVERAGRRIDLTPSEFRLLEFLMRNHDKVVTRQMMCEQLWETNWEGVTNVIEVHINRLRTKINLANEAQMIHTVRGSGYVLRAA